MRASDRALPGQSRRSRACKIDAYPRSSTKMLTFGIGSNDHLAALADVTFMQRNDRHLALIVLFRRLSGSKI
jgi:hypothetical protein